jgi:hypothetical protein
MKFQVIPALLIGIMVSIVTSKIVYFGFTPNYNTVVFSEQIYNTQFTHDVFKYRILSMVLLSDIYNWIDHSEAEKARESGTQLPLPFESVHFYYAYYYLNTFFLCLASIVLVCLFRIDNLIVASGPERYLLLVLSIIVINLSQFAVYSYDILSYLFQLLILFVFLKYFDKDYWMSLLGLCSLIFLSTLNRESSALSVSMLALLLFLKFGLSGKTFIGITLLSISFVGTYIALRYMIIDPHHVRFAYKNAGHLLYEINIMGLAFWALFFGISIVIANSKENRLMIVFFHLISAPYIITCFKDGVLWEVRLYIPLFIGSLVLGKLNYANFRVKLSSLLESISMKRRQSAGLSEEL